MEISPLPSPRGEKTSLTDEIVGEKQEQLLEDLKIHMIIRERIHLKKSMGNALSARIVSGDLDVPKERQ